MTFEKGEVINQIADKDVFFLVEGICALELTSMEGKSQVYDYFTGLRWVGFLPLLSQPLEIQVGIWSSFSLIAKTPCLGYHISDVDFVARLDAPPYP